MDKVRRDPRAGHSSLLWRRGQGRVAQWAWFVENGPPRARAGLGHIGGGEKSALETGLSPPASGKPAAVERPGWAPRTGDLSLKLCPPSHAHVSPQLCPLPRARTFPRLCLCTLASTQRLGPGWHAGASEELLNPDAQAPAQPAPSDSVAWGWASVCFTLRRWLCVDSEPGTFPRNGRINSSP